MHQRTFQVEATPAKGARATRILLLGFAICIAAACPGRVEAFETPETAPPATAAGVPVETPAGAPVDFTAEIKPILVMHCFRCHDADKRSGGLRLDSAVAARQGGDSNLPIVGGTLETNELYKRVSSSDRSYRMPKNAAPLEPEQIDKLRRWVQQGAPWPASENSVASESIYDRWMGAINRFTMRHEFEIEYLVPFAIAFVVAQVVLLAVSRAKKAYLNGSPLDFWRGSSVGKILRGRFESELGLAWLVLLVSLGLATLRARQLRLEIDLARANRNDASSTDYWRHTVFGSPPVPIRPDHGKQVAMTYYRGNCERNPELFNNGNYLTAIFRIELCDRQHETIEVGDAVPDGGLCVRCEIERAPGTTDLLFSDQIMASVFMSPHFYAAEKQTMVQPTVRLETLETGQRWVAYVPIESAAKNQQPSGLIYIYTGRIDDDGTISGAPHYAIKYDLAFEDGKLTDASDLWMNAFANSAFADPVPPSKLPFREWFDYRPLPAINGPNSTDPKLLGVEEYIRKGLITDHGAGAPANSPQPDEKVDRRADQKQEADQKDE